MEQKSNMTVEEIENIRDNLLMEVLDSVLQRKYFDILIAKKILPPMSQEKFNEISSHEIHEVLLEYEKDLPQASDKQRSILKDMIRQQEIKPDYYNRIPHMSIYEAFVIIDAVFYERQRKSRYPLRYEERGKLLYCLDHGYIEPIKPEKLMLMGSKTLEALISEIVWSCHKKMLDEDKNIIAEKVEIVMEECDKISKAGNAISDSQKYTLQKMLNSQILKYDELNGITIEDLSNYEAYKLISLGKNREKEISTSATTSKTEILSAKQEFALNKLLQSGFLNSSEIDGSIQNLSHKRAHELISLGKKREIEVITR